LNCANIIIDVENYPSFSNVTIPNPIVGGVLNTNGFGFNPGGSCAVVVARFYYNWPLFVTGLGYNISNLSGISGFSWRPLRSVTSPTRELADHESRNELVGRDVPSRAARGRRILE
jgi:hypothetical protein